jgi:hypothetical protein
VTIPSFAAQALTYRFSIAAVMRSGKRSGVQANVGTPRAANAWALSLSVERFWRQLVLEAGRAERAV